MDSLFTDLSVCVCVFAQQVVSMGVTHLLSKFRAWINIEVGFQAEEILGSYCLLGLNYFEFFSALKSLVDEFSSVWNVAKTG